MTTKPRARTFRLRRAPDRGGRTIEGEVIAAAVGGAAGAGAAVSTFDTIEPGSEATVQEELAVIRAEGLTGRQLRMARRVAQKHGLKADSDLDAVRLLRKRGIDPFRRASMLDLVSSADAAPAAAQPAGGNAVALAPRIGAERNQGLPQGYQPGAAPPARFGGGFGAEGRLEELQRIQRDIARRRRRRSALLAIRLFFFVILPTALTGYYFTQIATPLYATHSEFVIQKAEAHAGAPAGGLGGLFSGTALATSQDSITVQSYLQSREAMLRLDADHGFRAHFSAPEIDPVQRLEPGASNEEAYRLFQRHVKIGYDPSEGIVRMEVRAADPDTSTAFARALISYAEEQVDQLTQRLREDQMQGAMANYEDAQSQMRAAQTRVVELQERFEVLSSEIEVGLLTNQIAALEMELTRDRLSLQELMANPSPNRARVEPLERRIASLQSEIATLRAGLTRGSGAEGISLARVSSELVAAEADVHTRQLMLSQAIQQLEAARIEAGRQVRYLSLGVSPVAPDAPAYPRAFENTALAFLIFAGIYLMLSMTASILREQVSA